MNSQFIETLNTMYFWLPGEAIGPICFCILGFIWGMSRYLRSFKYMYYYYIEHGDVICTMDSRKVDMNLIAKKYKLPNSDYFEPHGYVTGLVVIVLCTALGIFVGTFWPLSLVVGILTIPNFALRQFAREKRNKVIFKQNLKGTK